MPDAEWHAINRDAANTKYSPLDQLDADNFNRPGDRVALDITLHNGTTVNTKHG